MSLFQVPSQVKAFFLVALLGITISQAGARDATVPDLPKDLQTSSPNKVVLLNFYSDYCGMCKQMEPYVSALYQENQKKMQLINLDVNNPNNRSYVMRYQITGTPTYILFNPNGKSVYRTYDSFSATDLQRNVLKATQAVKAAPAKRELICQKAC